MKILFSYLTQFCDETSAATLCEKFRAYSDYLIEQNKLFNLTSITDPNEIQTKHFIDSLSALPYCKGHVADIGSGAGFPGIPLKLLLPENEFTLIDSLQKRITFLSEVISRLSLTGIQTVHARAEDLNKTVLYDTIVSRAVSRLATLCEYCLPFVKIGGRMIAYKANDCDEEIQEAKKAISLLGGELEQIISVPLYHTDIVRKLILIRKIKDSPNSYPRGQNKPKKQPLC